MKMNIVKITLASLACLGLFFVLFYLNPFTFDFDNKLFLTIATFFFAIFTGFFISRQGKRYSSIRDHLAQFDGSMSFLYRSFGLFPSAQEEAKLIFEKHYKPVLEKHQWFFSFINKTSTLTDLQHLSRSKTAETKLSAFEHVTLSRMTDAMLKAQIARKKLISLFEERVPSLQWFIILFLMIALFLNLFVIYSYLDAPASIFKSIFGTALIFVILFLFKLDKLDFFDSSIGEKSAQDVLDITEGKK